MTKAKTKPNQTNEQLLRSLKGEKLALFLDRMNFCPDSPLECLKPHCAVCIMRWLRKEAKE